MLRAVRRSESLYARRMKTPKQKLEDWLTSFGWELKQVHEDDLEWWADEIWELRSTWRPNGTSAFVTFLVDPQWDAYRKKGQAIWGIGGCGHFPRSRAEAEEISTMSIKSPPKAEFERFLLTFDRLRDKVDQDGV